MYLVSRHEDLMTVLRDPIVFSQELGYYRQMAHGHLDEMKDILITRGWRVLPGRREHRSAAAYPRAPSAVAGIRQAAYESP